MTDDSHKGKASNLPPISDLAAQVRDGALIDDLAKVHKITAHRLIQRFNEAGYSARTGLTTGSNKTKKTILESVSIGAGGKHVGGGDWDRGLPIDTPVPHQRRRPRPTGLNWDAITPAAEPEPIEIPADLHTVDVAELLAGERYDEPAVDAAPKPQAQAEAPTNPHYDWDIWTDPKTDAESSTEAADPVPAAPDQPQRKPAGRPSFAFTPEQTAEIIHSYNLGETTHALAERLSTPTKRVHNTTVRNTLLRAGVTLRPRGRPTKPEPAQPAMEALKLRDGDQPLPIKNDAPDIQSQVIADIQARRQVGIQRYGTALQPHNGRDMLLDAYEEAMDLTIYLKGCLVERNREATR